MHTFFGSGVGLLVKIVIVSLLQSMGDERIVLLGRGRSLDLSLVLLYLFGVAGPILVLTSIYTWSSPGEGASRPHALVGGIAVALGGDSSRTWYFSTLSVVGVADGPVALSTPQP